MQRGTHCLRAVNKASGRRWSPIPKPPPPNMDRLCGTHSVLNALRAAYLGPRRQHPHRDRLCCLYVRDFSLAVGRDATDKDVSEVDGRPTAGVGDAESASVLRGNGGACRGDSGSQILVPPEYPSVQRIVSLARALNVEVKPVERRELVLLCGERRNQNIVLEAASFSPKDVVACPWHNNRSGPTGARDAYCGDRGARTVPQADSDSVLFLDHIIDPANVGAIIRSAFCLGLQRVVLSSDSASCTAAVARASAGLVEFMQVYRSVVPTCVFLENTMAQHQPRADDCVLEIYGSSTAPAHRWDSVESKGEGSRGGGVRDLGLKGSPHCEKRRRRLLLLGNEGSGLSPEVMQFCTHVAHVPLRWKVLGGLQCPVPVRDGMVTVRRRRPPETGNGGGFSPDEVAVLRPGDVSLNVSAAGALILASLLAGEQMVSIQRIR
ncbi:putative SpoU rRNA Methylase family [Trypanosoma vivax]|uniref:tRNA/rRNA methyltransferase SpoU type domain-containing protein n=1 Tax=Trypanosoma vivax (strain Y486) TaxID=1055687 RepID=G0TYY8_TRYVY|nr:hypothetical protein TRVL_00130 [Trypanosoma vivax]KAH8613040.1 putative SpoU rRNA Methylase family [Trypanosoma vivax]CCC49191.1 conserved hypothetical protein [Trypanosoma vivax Y486]